MRTNNITKQTKNNIVNIQKIDTDKIIDEAVKNIFQSIGETSIKINEQYYNEILKELNELNIYFKKIERIDQLKRNLNLKNPYAPKYGFSTSDIAYELQVQKKDSGIIYHKLNKILSLLRGRNELSYALYIKKNINNIERYYRYEVPQNEIDDFINIVQSTDLKNSNSLREYSEMAVKKLENALILSKHIEDFFKVIDNTGLKVKLPDKYEAYEYHFQNIDNKNEKQTFNHNFNQEGIRKWILGRGHDTVGWWVRGDIGLTSVKSVNLNNKFLFLNLASKNSLEKVYTLLMELFSNNTLNTEKISRIVKAFTPIVDDLQKDINTDVNSIIKEMINNLTK